MEECAKVLLGLFQTIRSENGITKELEIPMQYLTLSIEYALKKYGIEGKNIPDLTDIHWNMAIIKSGYIQNEIYHNMI